MLADRDDALFDVSPVTTNTRLVPADVCTARPARARAGVAFGLLDPRGREQPGLQLAVGIRHDGFDRRARAGRPRATATRIGSVPSNVPAGIRIHLEVDGLTDADGRDELLGNGQLHAQRIDAHDDRDLHAPGDVIADRDQPLGDQAGKRRADDGVGQRLARERDAGAAPPAATGTAAPRRSSPPRTCWRAASICVRRWSNSDCETTRCSSSDLMRLNSLCARS